VEGLRCVGVVLDSMCGLPSPDVPWAGDCELCLSTAVPNSTTFDYKEVMFSFPGLTFGQ